MQSQVKPSRKDRPSAFVIARAQLLLIDLGYRPGTADGVLDAYTEAAVRTFQIDRELNPDGRINAALLAELEIAHRELTVRRVQARLSALGYDPGPIDGTIGPRTRAAISVYEQQRGFPVTGDVTVQLLQQLQSDQAAALASVPNPGPPPETAKVREETDSPEPAKVQEVDEETVEQAETPPASAAPVDLEAAEPFDPTLVSDEEKQLLSAARTAPAAGAAGTGSAPSTAVKVATLPRVAVDAGEEGDDGMGVPLGRGDRVRLTIGSEGADIIEREIDEQGWLDLPGGLSVRAVGLTLAELKKAITVKLVENYLDELSVDISRPQESRSGGG